jgi:hypothetical protein
MSTFHLATSRQQRNPVRVQQWNGSLRAGDDLKLALTCYTDDLGTLVDLNNARSQLALYYDERGGPGWGDGYCCDYGWGWFTIPRTPAQTVAGYSAGTLWPGQTNFYLPPLTTQTLRGRYKLLLELDLQDGTSTQVEGILQMRGGITNTLGHSQPAVFTLDQSLLDGPDVLAGLLNDAGVAVDADGFPWQPSTGVAIVTPPGTVFRLVDTGLVAIGVDQGSALVFGALTNVFGGGAAGAGGCLPATVLAGTIKAVNATLLDKFVYPPSGGFIGSAAVNVAVILSPGQRLAFDTADGVHWFAS